ncbi:MAG: hypothetical protein QOJ41_2135 [Acidobacteriaceae bacterium]|jgi:hypothetical protein|nr:hypothetical protein [Acidobacteriaceae bacterium]
MPWSFRSVSFDGSDINEFLKIRTRGSGWSFKQRGAWQRIRLILPDVT